MGTVQRHRSIALLTLPVVLLISACDSLFDVDNPTDVTASELEGNAALLEALVNIPAAAGAEYYGDAIDVADVIADDMMQPGTNVDWLFPDRGELEVFNEAVENLYNNLASAWWHAQDATDRMLELVANPEAYGPIGRGYYWDALLRVTLADLFDPITFEAGPPLSPVEVYEGALPLLDQAARVAAAANETLYEAAAYATAARVHRSLYFELGVSDHLRQAAEFAAKALSIQPNFRLEALYQPPGRTNVLSGFSGNYGSLTNRGVGLRYINREDPASGMIDPRVQHTPQRGNGVHGPYYFHWKYPERNTPIPVTRWQEARLIVAEYRLLSGDLPGAVQEINAVRTEAGLPEFQSSDAATIRAQLIYERRTEFWLELRGWQDHRYYGIFPDNWTEASRQAGLNRRLPISRRERTTNPNL